MNSPMTLSPNAQKLFEALSEKPAMRIPEICTELEWGLDIARAAVGELKEVGLAKVSPTSGYVWLEQQPDAVERPSKPQVSPRPVTPAKPPVRVVQRPPKPNPFDDESELAIEVPRPRSSSEVAPKPQRSERQTQRGQKHPGSATKNRPTREDFTQNDHAWAILKMDLGNTEVAVAFRLQYLTYGTDKYGGKGVFQAPIDTAADLCKMSRRTFSRTLADLQEAGLFVRLDNAKGGRGNRNPLVIKPSLPAWHESGSEA